MSEIALRKYRRPGTSLYAVFGVSSDKFCGPEKNAKSVLAKEVLILIGREQGAGVSELSLIAGPDTSNVSRRSDAARVKLQTDRKLAFSNEKLGSDLQYYNSSQGRMGKNGVGLAILQLSIDSFIVPSFKRLCQEKLLSRSRAE